MNLSMNKKVTINEVVKSKYDDLNKLFYHVYNILSSFRIDLDREETLVRIERFHRYDKKLIAKTIKKGQYFFKVNNELLPKRVYSFEFKENADIYENRFVKSLLINELNKLVFESISMKNYSVPFLKAGLSYGEFGTNSIFKRYIYSLKHFKNNSKEEELINDLIIRLYSLINADLFKKVKTIDLNDIFPTNILLDDSDYSYIYKYYKKSIEINKDFKKEIVTKLFTLINEDKECNIIRKNNSLIKFTYNEFRYTFEFNEELDLTLTYLNNEDIFMNYKISLEKGINLNILKIMALDNKSYAKVISFKSTKEILELIKSLAIVIKENFNYCPICHKEIENESHCEACHANMLVINKEENLRFIYNAYELTLGEDYYD